MIAFLRRNYEIFFLSFLLKMNYEFAQENPNKKEEEDEDDGDDEKDYEDRAHFITRLASSNFENIIDYISNARQDDDVYKKILHLSSQTLSYKLFTSKKPDEHNYILREILSTEETFLGLLQVLIDEYLKPLANVMTLDEKRSTCLNIDAVHKLHSLFYKKLFDACVCKRGRTLRVCQVFGLFQKLFMKLYVDYFLNIQGWGFYLNEIIFCKKYLFFSSLFIKKKKKS